MGNMKTIITDSLTTTYFTSVSFMVLDGKITNQTIRFEVEIFENGDDLGIPFDEWVKRLIHGKLVINANDNIPSIVEPLTPYFDGIFSVQNTDKGYIAKTIYLILQTLIQDNLKSFKYD